MSLDITRIELNIYVMPISLYSSSKAKKKRQINIRVVKKEDENRKPSLGYRV